MREPCMCEGHWLFFPNTKTFFPPLIPNNLKKKKPNPNTRTNKRRKRIKEKKYKNPKTPGTQPSPSFWGSTKFALTFAGFQA